MTDREKRILKDGVISIFEKFNILDHTATIGGLKNDILRFIISMQEEPKPKFRKGDKVIYLNEEYVVEDITDHYILRSTRERTSVPVVHVGFGNEDYELRLVEEPVSKEIGYYDHKAVMESLHPELKEEPVSKDYRERYKRIAQSEAFKKTHEGMSIGEVIPIEGEINIPQVFDEGYWERLGEEPVSSIWHDASEPPIIDKTFLLIAPNGNSSLCLWGGKELHSVTIGGGHSVLCKGDIYSYIDDLLNLDNSCNFGKNWKKLEEPVSEELEKAAKKAATQTIGGVEKFFWNDYHKFKAGAKWQRQKDEHLIWQLSSANYEKGKQEVIDKACDWLNTHDSYATPTNVKDEELRKYLED